MTIPTKAFIDNLTLFNSNGDKFKVRNPQQNNRQTIKCLLITNKAKSVFPKNFQVKDDMVILAALSTTCPKKPLFMPTTSNKKLIPRI